MPRYARKKSKSGIYHIMMRGINQHNIFEDDEDKKKLLETIEHYKIISEYEVYCYCIMSNHIHLLMGEMGESLSLAIKRISSSYVYWYNWKYQRCGHLFQERFKSEPVDDDEYFLTVLRYILQNPVKAGICTNINDYSWSSYHEYIGKSGVTDIDFALDILSEDREKSLQQFKQYINQLNQDKLLEYKKQIHLTDTQVVLYFKEFGLSNINEILELEKTQRDEIIRNVKSIEGVSVRQLSRITGLSKSLISKIYGQ